MRAAASLRPDVSTVPRRIRWHPSLRLNSWLSFPLYYSRRPTSWTPSGSCPLCLTPPCYHFEPPATAALFSFRLPATVPFWGKNPRRQPCLYLFVTGAGLVRTSGFLCPVGVGA